MSYNLTHLHDLLSQKLGMSTINTYSIGDLEKKIRESTTLRVNRQLDARIASAYELARGDLVGERGEQTRINSLQDKVKTTQMQDIFKTDYDDLTEENKSLLMNQWRREHPEYTKDRDLIYRNLIANRVGTPYAHINNINAHYSSFGRPIKSSLSVTSDADYYYDVIVPKSAAILWWYERAFPHLTLVERTKWYNIIYVPNVMEATANLAEEIEEKGENVIGVVRGDVGSVLGGVGEGIGNAKYLFAGTAIVGVVTAIVVARK